MSIASEIQALQNDKTAIATAIAAKGGTVASGDGFDDFAGIINGMAIIKMGVSDSTLIKPSGQALYLPSSITSIGPLALSNMFSGCTGLTSTGLNNITSISGSGAMNRTFYGCTGLTSIGLDNLTSIANYAMQNTFDGCSSLVSVNLGNLTTIGTSGMNSVFQSCTNLTSVDFSSLASIGETGLGYCFANTKLSSVEFTSLNSIAARGCLYGAFQHCTSLTSLYFPSLTVNSFGSYTNQFLSMLGSGTSNCTVHFPAAIQSTIGSWTDVLNGFGGTNTTVLFDL